MKMTCTTIVYTRNSANHQFALPQVKTTNYGLRSYRYRTAKYCNFVQNTLNLNFANNFFCHSKKFFKAFKKNIHLNQQSCDLYKGIQLIL